MSDQKPIPSWLETPAIGEISPPVATRPQELPFSELTWENFERLCLRLARQEADVEHCQLYGLQGEDQQGIDIFARVRATTKYRVYQCKRESNFGPAKIRTAIDRFLAGTWKERTDVLYLCTKESMRGTQRSDEIESQRAILAPLGITLLPWDSHQLSQELKGHPILVDDFFGRQWVNAFCGEDAANSLGSRLDFHKVANFRSQLAQFYKNLFSAHDPGLPHGPLFLHDRLPLEDRFIVPDVYDRRTATSPTDAKGEDRAAFEPQSVNSRYFNVRASAIETPTTVARKSQLSSLERQSVDRWLPTTKQTVLLGDPGSGKSSLLRYIALDLLHESPQLEVIANRWGRYLPVWVPFAFWTKLVATDSSASSSLTGVLLQWLKSFSEERLWPLVEAALADDRLLLLVDGLDESENEDAATIALNKLQVFADQRGAPVIATSRPRGFERLRSTVQTWRVGRIADFTVDQQQQLSVHWFRHLFLAQSKETESRAEVIRRADAEAQAFVADLDRTADLAELARIPLLLCLLIYHRLQNATLPTDRFRAYESIIEHLITTHPRRRRVAALVAGSDEYLPDDDIKAAFASVAYHIQCNGRSGTITQAEATDALYTFLSDEMDGFGLPHTDARTKSHQLLSMAEGIIGLLIKRSPDEVGFFHRTFQEYLAGYHLSRLSLEEQRTAIAGNAVDPQWHEVILSLFHLTRRSEDVATLLKCIDGPSTNLSLVAQYARRLLKAEIAFGNFRCPTGQSRLIAKNVFLEIERSHWMPHREELLRVALNGLRSTTVGSLVREKVSHWFPCRQRWKTSAYNAMSTWSVAPEVVECLWHGIYDDELYNQRAAAQALATIARRDEEIGDGFVELALGAILPSIRAVATEAVLHGWPQHPRLADVIASSRDSLSPELRFTAIRCRVSRGEHTATDLNELLTLACWDTGVDHTFRTTLADTILEGWPASAEVKAACLRGVAKAFHHERGTIGKGSAFEILLRGFSSDDDVAKACLAEIRDNEYPFNFGNRGCWELMAHARPSNAELLDAIDDWIAKHKLNGPELYHASLITRSPRAKIKLLALLDQHFRFWAVAALLDGWGMEDPAVATSLTALATGDNAKAAAIGTQLPRIILDRTTCQRRLLELLHDATISRPDFVLGGLHQIGVNDLGVDITATVFDTILSRQNIWAGDLASVKAALFTMFPTERRVRQLAENELSSRLSELACPSVGTIARVYQRDEQMRKLVMSIVRYLPDQLRMLIVHHLDAMPVTEAFSLMLLSQYDLEQSPDVKTQASIAYHRRLRLTNADQEPTLRYLADSIVCSGPDYEARQQAAFCALIELDRLDVIQRAEEELADRLAVGITLQGEFGFPNIPVLKQILSHWKMFESAGADGLHNLIRYGGAEGYWNELCLLADQYSIPREAALRQLDMPRQQAATTNELQFLARVKPGSRLLLEHCVNILQFTNPASDPSGVNAVTAAEILGSNFADDDDALALVLAGHNPQRLYQKVVLALCEGWPSHDILRVALQLARSRDSRLSDETIVRIVCRRGTVDEVYDIIAHCLSIRRRLPQDWEQMIAKPIIRRLATDDALLARLMGELHEAPTASKKVSFPMLISSASVGMTEIRDWSIQELDHQLAGTPQVGIDIVTGSIRPIVHALLEVLSLPSV